MWRTILYCHAAIWRLAVGACMVKWCVQLTDDAKSAPLATQLQWVAVDEGTAKENMQILQIPIGDAVVVKKRIDAKAKAKVAAKPKAKPNMESKGKKAPASKGVKRDLQAAEIGQEGSGNAAHDADGDGRLRTWLHDVQSAVLFSLARRRCDSTSCLNQGCQFL